LGQIGEEMPALACCVDAAVAPPPGYAFAWDSSLPAPDPFSGVPQPTNTTTTVPSDSHWSPSLSSALYRIDGWGGPYFSVNSSGNISVRPHGLGTLSHQEIDLVKVVKKASDPKSTGGLGPSDPAEGTSSCREMSFASGGAHVLLASW